MVKKPNMCAIEIFTLRLSIVWLCTLCLAVERLSVDLNCRSGHLWTSEMFFWLSRQSAWLPKLSVWPSVLFPCCLVVQTIYLVIQTVYLAFQTMCLTVPPVCLVVQSACLVIQTVYMTDQTIEQVITCSASKLNYAYLSWTFLSDSLFGHLYTLYVAMQTKFLVI